MVLDVKSVVARKKTAMLKVWPCMSKCPETSVSSVITTVNNI